MRILDIVRGTTVDGPGFRTSIYFAGCGHHCPGCHNPQSWDFAGGSEMSLGQLTDIITEEDFDVTLTGGDPLYQHEKWRGWSTALSPQDTPSGYIPDSDGRRLWRVPNYSMLSGKPRLWSTPLRG